MIVSAGFTAPLEQKKLASTTYRLSSSCALQLRSSALVFGSSAKTDRAVLVRDSGKRNALAEKQIAGKRPSWHSWPWTEHLRLLLHQSSQAF